MSDFKAKMLQIRFRLGLRPRPRWGSLQRSPRTPSWYLRGLPLWEGKGKEGGQGGKEGREMKERGEGRKGKGGGPGCASPNFEILATPLSFNNNNK